MPTFSFGPRAQSMYFQVGKVQTLTNTVSTTGLARGSCHAVVRADNIKPVSGKPMSALYYDADFEVTGAGNGKTSGGK